MASALKQEARIIDRAFGVKRSQGVEVYLP